MAKALDDSLKEAEATAEAAEEGGGRKGCHSQS